MKRELSIRWYLPLVLGLLVELALLPAIALGFFTTRDNTARLLRDKVELLADALVERIGTHLNPVAAQLDYLADRVERGELDPDDRPRFDLAIRASLAGTPQAVGIGYVAPDGTLFRYARDSWNDIQPIPLGSYPGAVQSLEQARLSPARIWLAPALSPIIGQTILPRMAPLYTGGTFRGALIGVVTTGDLSRYMAQMSGSEEYRPFALWRGDQVLAHPILTLQSAAPRPKPGQIAVDLQSLGDPVLATIWTGPQYRLGALAKLHDADGHWADGPNGSWVYIYRRLVGYGPEPWTVGAYYSIRESQRERRLVWVVPIAGVGLLLMATGVALRLARRLGNPAVALGEAAARIETLDLKPPPRFQRGRIAELNRAFDAFERMAGALAWFETYLPRSLVRWMIAAGPLNMTGERRVLTVMFTDLEGYSDFSRDRPADEIAAYLNALLARIGPAVEASGGTIDKYIGDGMMVFWGAPEPRPDHAAAACGAACSIAGIVAAFNRERRAAGLEACRMRIGLHTGPVIVGNIGFEGRMNYTIVGETVNEAQRLEQAGRRVIGAEEVVVLISTATHDAVGGGLDCEMVPENTPIYRLRVVS